jgi:8-oxo-dGTP pyrophosphatase MutT (NUDIX family)
MRLGTGSGVLLLFHARAAAAFSSTRRWASSTSPGSTSEPVAAVIPRAAVSVVARCECSKDDVKYALVQRGKEPNKGIWSFAGGKIESGESTLDAAMRELWEETRLGIPPGDDGTAESVDATISWHTEGPVTSSDSIHVNDGLVQWHYVISQFFARIEPVHNSGALVPPKMMPSDDAADADFFSLADIEEGIDAGRITPGVLRVIRRVEAMHTAGLLSCK